MKSSDRKNKKNRESKLLGLFNGNQNLRFRNICLFLTFLSFIYYGNTLRNGYSLDDVYVTNNEQVKKGFSALPEIFSSLYTFQIFEEGKPLNFGYRPVVKATFAIEYAFFGKNPHISHLINILLYVLTVCLVFLIFRLLLNQIYHQYVIFPLLATIIFLIHPIHTEVVSSLKNRDELLSFLFGLLALILFYHFVSGKGFHYLILGFVSFIIAYLSKSSAIAFLAIIPFLLWFMPQVNRKKIIVVGVLLIITWLGIKLSVAQMFPDRYRPKQIVENPMLNFNQFERIPTGIFILLFYLKMIFLPYPMRFYYGYNLFPVKGWDDPVVWISLMLHLGLLALAIYSFRRWRWLFWGIFIYLIFISMYTNIVRLIMGIAADRFLYAPSLGFSLIVAGLLLKMPQNNYDLRRFTQKAVIRTMLILLFLLLTTFVLTIQRNIQWRSQESLVKHDIRFLKNSARANYIYAGMLKNEALKDAQDKNGFHSWEKVEQSLEHYRQAIKVYPGYYQAYNMMGLVYFEFYQNQEKALSYFKKAIELNPSYVPALGNLAWTLFKMKNYQQAEKYYREAIQLSPDNPKLKQELNDLLEEAGEILKKK